MPDGGEGIGDEVDDLNSATQERQVVILDIHVLHASRLVNKTNQGERILIDSIGLVSLSRMLLLKGGLL